MKSTPPSCNRDFYDKTSHSRFLLKISTLTPKKIFSKEQDNYKKKQYFHCNAFKYSYYMYWGSFQEGVEAKNLESGRHH
jgi:hypothetical protein